MSLTHSHYKIIVIGSLLLMGLTLAKSIAVYDVMRQQLESTLGRGLNVALQSKAHFLESQIERGLANTRTLTTPPFLAQSIQQLNVQPSNIRALRDLTEKVNSLLQAGFSAAIVYDIHGNALSQAGDFSGNQVPSLPLNQYMHTALLWNGQFILRTRKDLLDRNGHSIGSITTESPLPQLTRSFDEIREIGKTGEFILCAPPEDSEKEVACLMSQIDGVKFKHLSYLVEDEAVPMNYALEGKNGVMTVKDYRRIRVIEAYAPLPVIGLGMVLKLDEEELLRPATEKLKTIVLYLAGLIIAEILLLNWFVRKLIKSRRETRRAKAKTKQFSIQLSHKESELQERLREITCLYDIRRSIGMELTIDSVCQQIFKHLIPALQYPENVFVVIEIEGKRITSMHHNQTLTHELRSEISINGKASGQLSVFYPEGKPLLLQEEQQLIDTIASDLGSWLERKHLERALVSIAEKQQHTIGQELHDNLGQQVAAIGYQVRALEKKIFATGNKEMAGVAASIATQAQTIVIQIKQLAQGLLPFELEAHGLISALQTLATRITTTYNITCDFSYKDTVIIHDNNIALNLYRIAQEAANNAIRHGNAQHLVISLTTEEKMLRLSICDDGCGLADNNTEQETIQGMGIRIMQYRAKQLGAQLEFLPRAEGGTTVRLEMQMD